MEKFGKLVLGLLIGIPFTLWAGVIFSDYWRWFIVPTFGFDPITWVQGVGVNLVAAFIVFRAPKQHDQQEDLVFLVISRAIYLALFWITGWAYHFFLF